MSKRPPFASTKMRSLRMPAPKVESVVRYAHLTDLEGSLSLHNAGDARNPLIQPYDGGHPPYIGAGHELVARIAYAF